MVKRIIVTNPMRNTLELDLRRPEKSGLYVKSIKGLGPPKADISSSDNITVDGSNVYSSSIKSRNIVFELGFLYDYPESIEELRNKTYEFFPIKRKITLDFYTDKFINGVTITGYVEKNEPDIFKKDEGCQVSLICNTVYFKKINALEDGVIIDNNDGLAQALFSFPFPNDFEEIITGDIYRHILSEQKDARSLDFSVLNPGTVNCGLIGKIFIKNDISGYINLYVNSTDDQSEVGLFRLSPVFLNKANPELGTEFKADDVIEFSSIPGKLYVKLYRNGIEYKIMQIVTYLTSGLNPWPLLNPGLNILRLSRSNDIKKIEIYPDTMYEGI